MNHRAKLQVSPIESYIEEDVNVEAIGCPADAHVTIRAKMYDEDEKMFASYGVFKTDRDGYVNVSTAAPIEGSYQGADASGLFWSMERSGTRNGDFFIKREATPVSIELLLEIDGKFVNTTTLNRYFYSPDISKETIDTAGITGVMFSPIHKKSCPGILLLSGSDGGMDEHAAALLASNGYAVLALAYFDAENVPKNLENIPLEYFQNAAQWLKSHPTVNGQLAVIGFSRGGELALLLGTVFGDFQAVVAVSPSAYVTAGMRNGIFAPVPSWTYNQEALDYLKFSYRPRTIFSMLWNWMLRRPISYLSIWDNTLKNLPKESETRIPVEKIKSPVMTIAGNDDQLWPSAYYSKQVEKTLDSQQSYENEHVYYKGAGHFLSFPYSLPNLPTNVLMNVGGGMTMTFGGTKSANAKAAKDSKFKILAFLEKSIKTSETQ